MTQTASSPRPPRLRRARPADVPAITRLLAQLGYPDEEDSVRARLERLGARTDAGVLVVELDAAVAAVAAYQLIQVLERDQPQCRVTTLVVDERRRRLGLARALLSAIQAIAEEHRCFRLEVTTRVDRADAAAFYTAFGLDECPRRLIKRLRAE